MFACIGSTAAAPARSPRPTRPRAQENANEGWAAVDAIVALTLLASTIVFSMAAVHTGQSAAGAARDMRVARDMLVERLEGAAAAPGATSGEGPRGAWRVVVEEPVLASGPAALCRRTAAVELPHRGRSYELATARICPADEESGG